MKVNFVLKKVSQFLQNISIKFLNLIKCHTMICYLGIIEKCSYKV